MLDISDTGVQKAYFSGKPDKFVVDNTNDIKQHDRDWEEIGKY